MLNKMTIVVAFFFLFACACGPTDPGTGAPDISDDVPEGDNTPFIPLCSDPWTCTPGRCDVDPIVLAFSDLEVPFKVEGSFSSPLVTYGVADDAFFKVTWLDTVVEWLHIPGGNHTFSLEYSCHGSTWTVTATLDDETTIHTFTTTAPECENPVTFMPAINAAPDTEFGPICTAE